MYYTIYKVTNKINGKYYIGKHQTEDLDDDYMGSGKLIRRAIEKHGIENFTKEILHVFNNEEDMNEAEKKLVVVSEETYNLCDGGKGGWSYVNREGLNAGKFTLKFVCHLSPTKQRGITFEELYGFEKAEFLKKKHSKLMTGKKSGFKDKLHSEETKQKMRKSKNVGKHNSQYGTCWITDGKIVKKIPKNDLDKWIELGYNKGRKRLLDGQ